MSNPTTNGPGTELPTSAPTLSPPPPPNQDQLLQIFAIRAQNDYDAMTLYAAIIGSVIGMFIVFKVIDHLGRKASLRQYSAAVRSPFSLLVRLLMLKVRGAPSLGHVILFATYVGLNVGFMFVYIDDSVLSLHVIIAARTGWLAVANICLTVFLSLKNTPLGFLTGWSYERLNSLHRVSGMTSLILVIIHGVSYSSFFLDQQNSARLRVKEEIFGIVAGFTVLMVVAVALTLQRRVYELFYFLHIFFFVVSMIFICLHHPTAGERVIIAIGVATGIWLLDRVVRASRLVYHGINNSATLQPLPNGGTRVILHKRLVGAKSGEHAFLWIPGIRLLQTHPFTITCTEPLEFVIASRDGFTRDLHQYAGKNSGAIMKASVEGPYGQVPDPSQYDKVLIFAGGSGGSFAFGSALRLLQSLEGSVNKHVTIVWTMRDSTFLEWFSPHLNNVANAQGFKVSIHITGQTELRKLPRSQEVQESSNSSTGALVLEDLADETSNSDLSHQKTSQQHLAHGLPVHYGRPMVHDLVAQAVDGMSFSQSVLVMGCGPSSLLEEVRRCTTSRMVTWGPQVSLHCEQFGW
ncbi:ferric reductase like transmembrane component [Ilyonectria robusta]|uniref:ferric reductase like transmembrane component n=1 Tax=Ilyonectria robusta TaxID=1079257 RepID=UPI001E8D4812|nr:ferric reductase like transmembrane component [Ilyonectria robusta]KAH8694383.1 ferric reductase like transmembrane component [Ilyonectria robusta]